MINFDLGKRKELTTELAYRHGLINHNMKKENAKSEYKAKTTLSRFAKAIGLQAGQIIRVAFKGGEVIHGRFPACVRGISSVARDNGDSIASIREVGEHDFKKKITKADKQQFFYSHL